MIPYSRLRAAAVLAFLVPVAAIAQTSPQTSPTAPAKPPHVMAQLKNTSKNVEEHISELHSQLQITPAEETQWAAFAQVMRDNATQMDAAFAQRGDSLQAMNAVQDLQSYAQISQVQSDNMQKLASSFQTLYASFPAAQQKVADTVFQPRHVKQ